jgi:carbonic anhydrase
MSGSKNCRAPAQNLIVEMDRPKWCCRRRFLQMAGSAGLLAALSPGNTFAQGDYRAMLLSCIDPRMVASVYKYMDQLGLIGQYSQFVIAGAAIAVVAPKFETWQPAFWDNLATSVQLHRITKLIVIDHRDCGAARIAYGAASIADPATETQTHRKALAEFRRAVSTRHSELTVETGLMALDGSLQMFS